MTHKKKLHLKQNSMLYSKHVSLIQKVSSLVEKQWKWEGVLGVKLSLK